MKFSLPHTHHLLKTHWFLGTKVSSITILNNASYLLFQHIYLADIFSIIYGFWNEMFVYKILWWIISLFLECIRYNITSFVHDLPEYICYVNIISCELLRNSNFMSTYSYWSTSVYLNTSFQRSFSKHILRPVSVEMII